MELEGSLRQLGDRQTAAKDIQTSVQARSVHSSQVQQSGELAHLREQVAELQMLLADEQR